MKSTQSHLAESQAMLMRLHAATLGAATRTRVQINTGLEHLKHQEFQQKSGAWLNQTAWIMDMLKNDAMTGLDITMIIDGDGESAAKESQSKIAQAGMHARTALFSAASPLQCARRFSQEVKSFTSLCADVAAQLEVLANTHTQEDDESLAAMYRTKPAQAQQQEPA